MILKYIFLAHYFLAFLVAIHVIISARSSQAILAWIIGLIFVPYLSLLLYIFFGYSRFSAYAEALQESGKIFIDQAQIISKELSLYKQPVEGDLAVLNPFVENMSGLFFTKGNAIRLLINGEETYKQIFKSIESAKNYILLQYYIVRNDRLGRFLKNLLIKKAKQGIQIYFLYDAWGSHTFFHYYVRQLRKAGVQVASLQAALI
jgi:cardiolipin synthase